VLEARINCDCDCDCDAQDRGGNPGSGVALFMAACCGWGGEGTG